MNNGMGDGRIINYLLEIRAFHDRLEAGGLSAQAIALWYALMHIANKTGWKDEFSAAASALSLHAGLSASGVKRAREALRSAGLIEWKARGGNRASLYRLKSCAVRYGARDERELGNGMRAGFRDKPWDAEADGGAPDGGLMAGSWAEPQPGRKRAPRDGLRYGPHDGSEGGGKSGEPSGPRNGPQSGCVPKQDRENSESISPHYPPQGRGQGRTMDSRTFGRPIRVRRARRRHGERGRSCARTGRCVRRLGAPLRRTRKASSGQSRAVNISPIRERGSASGAGRTSCPEQRQHMRQYA